MKEASAALNANDVMMPPANMAGTATIDWMARRAMPDSPWPLVQPDARRLPVKSENFGNVRPAERTSGAENPWLCCASWAQVQGWPGIAR
jgi:hypothetical protein